MIFRRTKSFFAFESKYLHSIIYLSTKNRGGRVVLGWHVITTWRFGYVTIQFSKVGPQIPREQLFVEKK